MKALKWVRCSKGLTQKALAERSGVNYRTIQDYEQDGGVPIEGARLSTLLALAKVLECRITDILDDQDLIRLYQEVENG